MPPYDRFSLFLTPCDAEFVHLEALIRELGLACAAIPFEPHVTVYSGSLTDPDLLKRTVVAALERTGPFPLKVTGIGFSVEYFKSVFVEFEENLPLRGIHDRLKRGLGEDSGYVLAPHLSLLYSDKPLAEKADLARRIVLDRQDILFDRVKVVVPQNPLDVWRDIGGWRTLFSMKLGGAD